MNRRLVHLVAAFLMLAVFGFLGLRFWSNAQRRVLPLVSAIHGGPQGRVYLILGDTLYIEDNDAHSLDVVPLKRFGLAGFIGDFAVLADGSLILPARHVERPKEKSALLAQLHEIFFPVEARSVQSGLTRCSPKTFKCTPLKGKSGADYFHTDNLFKLAVDEKQGRIYVTDTAYNRLLILDMSGRILARQTTALQYPNQLELVGPNLLELADTDNDRLQRFNVKDDHFLPAGNTSARGWSAAGKNRQLYGFARTANGTRWVVITDGVRRHGRFLRLARGAVSPVAVDLPAGANVRYVWKADGEVLVPDRARHTIYTYAADGTAFPDFGSPRLRARLAAINHRFRVLGYIYDGSLYALFGVFALMLAVYWFSKERGYFDEALIEGVKRNLTDYLSEAVSSGAGDAGDGGWPEIREANYSQVSWTGRDYVLQPRSSVIRSKSRRTARIMLVAYALLMPVLIYLVLFRHRHVHWHWDWGKALHDPHFTIGLPAAVLASLWWYWSSRVEKLRINRAGISYQSPLMGLLAVFARFKPSWTLRWDEIEKIEFARNERVSKRGVKGAVIWEYRLYPKTGAAKRIKALRWQLKGREPDTGLTLRDLRRGNPEAIRAAIVRTWLFRLLDLGRRRNLPAQ